MFDDFVNEILGVADDVQQEYYLRAVSELAVYFNSQPVVRCFVTNTNGFGHQVSTVNMMKRLIAYGFRQTIALVYDDTGVPDMETIKKLAILLPEIIIPTGGGNPAPINLNGCVVTFVPYSTYYHGPGAITPPAVNLDFGFTGGYDDQTDLRNSLNTEYFLILQPFQWGQAYYGNSILSAAGRIRLDNLPPLAPLFNSRAFYMPDPTLTDAQWDQYLDKTKGAESAHLLYAFATHNDPEENVSIDLCSIYGISNANGHIPLVNPNPEDYLFNLACGIIQNNNNIPVDKKKPTVLLVLANVKAANYTNLRQYFLGNNLNNNVTAQQFVVNNALATRVDILQDGWDSSTLLTLLDNMQNNELLIVSLPGLPPDVFNQMMYASTLPIVFEGKNTANLALNFPKPFLWLSNNQVYPTLPLGAPHGAVEAGSFAAANSMQVLPSGWPAVGHPAELIVTFINNTNPNNAPTPYTNYFNNLANFYHSQVNDKLFMAMQAFLSVRV